MEAILCVRDKYFLWDNHLLNQNSYYLLKFKYFFFFFLLLKHIFNQIFLGFFKIHQPVPEGDQNISHYENDLSRTNLKHDLLLKNYLNCYSYAQLISYQCLLLYIQVLNLKTCQFQQMNFTLFLSNGHKYSTLKKLLLCSIDQLKVNYRIVKIFALQKFIYLH